MSTKEKIYEDKNLPEYDLKIPLQHQHQGNQNIQF